MKERERCEKEGREKCNKREKYRKRKGRNGEETGKGRRVNAVAGRKRRERFF
jgi:hypothetical protein